MWPHNGILTWVEGFNIWNLGATTNIQPITLANWPGDSFVLIGLDLFRVQLISEPITEVCVWFRGIGTHH